VDGDGDGYADGRTDADGKVTLGFIDAGAHDVHALRGYYDENNNYAYVQLIDNDTAILPAKVTMTGGTAQTATVSVRVEGVSENILFSPSFTVGNSGGKILTVMDAVREALGAKNIYYGESGGFIYEIDGVADNRHGGPVGGWNYVIADAHLQSGAVPSVGMAALPIADGDEIVVYCINAGFTTLFPAVNVTLNPDKSLTVTIKAWETDWSTYQTALRPVPGVHVSWAENTAFAFTDVTDADGTLVIPAAKASVGKHTLQISKTDASGLPDIVRLAPGYTVEVTQTGASSQTPETAADEVYIKVTGPSGTLFARNGFPWYRGVTPFALLQSTGLSYETDATGAYVKSIAGVAEFDYGPNSGWLYKVNGIETIKESAAAYKLNAGDELEWFYTRDYTKESGSSAWSTAPAAEEGAATVALRPEAEAVNGAVAVKLNDEDVKKAVSEAQRDKADEIAITPKITGEASKVSVELSAASARSIANDTTADLALKTALGDLRVAHEGLAALTKGEDAGPLTLSIDRSAGLVSAIVAVDGKPVQNVEGGLKLRVPSAEKPSAGTVAVLVREDGAEEVVLLSSATAGGTVVILDGSATIRIEDRSRAFDDVREGAWYKEDADFVSARALFRGTGENAFSGDLPMTRAMLVTVFHRLAGAPAAAGNAFSDVPAAAWYREAAQWAADKGIVLGTDEGFAGGREITREQIATMAMRFAASVGADLGDPAELSRFTDSSAISAWAKESVEWAVGTGLLQGDGNRLNPGGSATRAEVAAILRRFVEHWVEVL
jgi:hypothetical protein